MGALQKFQELAEADVRSTWRPSPSTLALLHELAPADQAAFLPILPMLGAGEGPERPTTAIEGASPAAIRGAVRLLLLRFRADTSDPVWSSRLLENSIAACLALAPRTASAELIGALGGLLGRVHSFTPPVGHLVRDLFLLLRIQAQPPVVDTFASIIGDGTSATAAQAYLAAFVLRRPIAADDVVRVVVALDGSGRLGEVLDTLALDEELNRPATRAALSGASVSFGPEAAAEVQRRLLGARE